MLKKLLIALLPLGAIAVVVWLVIPEYRALEAAKAQRIEAEEALQSKEELLAKIKRLTAQYREVGDAALKVPQIIPKTPDIPNLLVEIPEIAVQHGVTLHDLSFNAQEDTRGGRQPQQGSSSASAYESMNATLSLSASYDALKAFLAALEKELRIMDVQSLQVAAQQGEAEGGSAADPILKITMIVRMYYGLTI